MSSLASKIFTQSLLWQRGLARLKCYIQLIKGLQTGLLLVTAAAGYLSGCCLNVSGGSLAALLGSLFLTVSGSTVINMAYDRDIDTRMARTTRRPLPSGMVSAAEAWVLGALLVAAGLIWALRMDLRYAGVVSAGVFLDVVVYTIQLKRRTPYSILIGGLAGGMPVLAGRVLAAGQMDGIGLLLAAGVLLWIPTHILTFSIRYQDDYAQAKVPTFPAAYGITITRRIIAGSTLLAILTLLAAGWLIGLSTHLLAAMSTLGILLLAFVLISLVAPGAKINFALYKGASFYMLLSMLLVIAGGW
jgi:protoheme IX farnesyltransferase